MSVIPAPASSSLFHNAEGQSIMQKVLKKVTPPLQCVPLEQGGVAIKPSEHISTEQLQRLHALGVCVGDHLIVQRQNVLIPRQDVMEAIGAENWSPEALRNIELVIRVALQLLNLDTFPAARWCEKQGGLIASYSHHGIILEDGQVVHFTSPDGDNGFNAKETFFLITPFELFLNSKLSSLDDVRVVEHQIAFPRKDSAALALLLATKYAKKVSYNPVSFNCEHFAHGVRTGDFRSPQAELLEARVRELKATAFNVAEATSKVVIRGVEDIGSAVTNFAKKHPKSTITMMFATVLFVGMMRAKKRAKNAKAERDD